MANLNGFLKPQAKVSPQIFPGAATLPPAALLLVRVPQRTPFENPAYGLSFGIEPSVFTRRIFLLRMLR